MRQTCHQVPRFILQYPLRSFIQWWRSYNESSWYVWILELLKQVKCSHRDLKCCVFAGVGGAGRGAKSLKVRVGEGSCAWGVLLLWAL